MEILSELPKELKWNVLKYLQHPLAELVKSDPFQEAVEIMQDSWYETWWAGLEHYSEVCDQSDDPDAIVMAQRCAENTLTHNPSTWIFGPPESDTDSSGYTSESTE